MFARRCVFTANSNSSIRSSLRGWTFRACGLQQVIAAMILHLSCARDCFISSDRRMAMLGSSCIPSALAHAKQNEMKLPVTNASGLLRGRPPPPWEASCLPNQRSRPNAISNLQHSVPPSVLLIQMSLAWRKGSVKALPRSSAS